MQHSQGGGESDLAEGVRRHCMKNSPSFLFCIGKGQKKVVTLAAKSRQFTADKTGKGQFLPRKPKESGRRGSSEKDFVSTKSSECV